MDFGIFIMVPTTVGATPKGLVCVPCKTFSHPNFSYLHFSNHTHILKPGAANSWETTNSKPPEPIIMITQFETLTSRQSILITLFCDINLAFVCPLPTGEGVHQIPDFL